MDIDHRGEMPEPVEWPRRIHCPTCGVSTNHPDDVRLGYCWTCHDFTGEPTTFVVHPGDEAFGERVHDKMTNMPPRTIRVLTDEEHEKMMADNLATFRYAERWSMQAPRPDSFALLPGQTRPSRSLWFRLHRWMRRHLSARR